MLPIAASQSLDSALVVAWGVIVSELNHLLAIQTYIWKVYSKILAASSYMEERSKAVRRYVARPRCKKRRPPFSIFRFPIHAINPLCQQLPHIFNALHNILLTPCDSRLSSMYTKSFLWVIGLFIFWFELKINAGADCNMHLFYVVPAWWTCYLSMATQSPPACRLVVC